MVKNDITYMRLALEEAKYAFDRNEVPIGAILVSTSTGTIAAQHGNRTIEHSDPTAHAEILCLRDVCKQNNKQRLPGYTLYVTLEPCPMCAAALSFARLDRIVFGASDIKSGGLNKDLNLYEHTQLHHKPKITSGILAEECGQILKDFFKKKRQEKK